MPQPNPVSPFPPPLPGCTPERPRCLATLTGRERWLEAELFYLGSVFCSWPHPGDIDMDAPNVGCVDIGEDPQLAALPGAVNCLFLTLFNESERLLSLPNDCGHSLHAALVGLRCEVEQGAVEHWFRES